MQLDFHKINLLILFIFFLYLFNFYEITNLFYIIKNIYFDNNIIKFIKEIFKVFINAIYFDGKCSKMSSKIKKSNISTNF
jgi:hypothetical protein